MLQDLKLKLSYQLGCSNCFVAYAPENSRTTKVIQELGASLPIIQGKIGKYYLQMNDDMNKLDITLFRVIGVLTVCRVLS